MPIAVREYHLALAHLVDLCRDEFAYPILIAFVELAALQLGNTR